MSSVHTPTTGRWGTRVALAVVGVAATSFTLLVPAQADPIFPGGPDIPGVPSIAPGSSMPGTSAPTISPGSGDTVGGLRAIDIFYKTPVVDRKAAEGDIKVSPSTNVPGHFNWVDNNHVQWVPDAFWPRNTSVNVSAAGATSAFKISDVQEGIANVSTHQFIVKIGGDVVKTMPASMGKRNHETPLGTFPVIEKFREMVMDSSTYGVPVSAPEGYKLDVEYATRLTWSGIFVHAAPWSTGQQGNSNVSHGCINLSTANAKWYYENVRNGDTVTVES